MFDITGYSLPLTPKIYSQDIRLLGQTQHGIYDEVENLDPILLHRYYGAASSQTENHPGGDINNPDPNSSESESEDESIPSPTSQPTSNSDSDSDSDSDSESSFGPSSNSNPDDESDDGATTAGVEDDQVVSWQEITETITKAQR